jgi:hypothetical protein
MMKRKESMLLLLLKENVSMKIVTIYLEKDLEVY